MHSLLALLALLLALLLPSARAFHFTRIGRRQQHQQAKQQQAKTQRLAAVAVGGEEQQEQQEQQPTDRGLQLAERAPRRARSIKGVRCPTCLSADSDEFVVLLAESILPQHGGKRSGGGGGGEAVWAAMEGLLPSDQALALYASKPWIDARQGERECAAESAELSALAAAAVARWA